MTAQETAKPLKSAWPMAKLAGTETRFQAFPVVGGAHRWYQSTISVP